VFVQTLMERQGTVRAGLPAGLVDVGLELSVVGSFSAVGYRVRRWMFGWQPPVGDLAGRTALVTGPTSGLGRAVATGLAAAGARVVLVGRDRDKLDRLRRELTALTGTERYPVVVADMSSPASVRAAVDTISATEDRLDIVIDNAGAMYAERAETDDGIERTLAVVVVGPFVLLDGLLPLLRRSPDARVVAVSSGGMYAQPVDFDDLGWHRRAWSGPRAYAQAKRIQVALAREWARRLAGTSVTVNAMHPGWVDTPGLADSMPGFHRVMGPLLRSPEQGADTILWLAASPEARDEAGGLYLDRRRRPFDRYPGTRLSAAQRRELWRIVSDLAGAAGG
jgi:dehydrogenase/reductase SDR family member 12